ncbi:hypothetical protein [Streptomyces sp. WAC06614]|uniref:DUF7919 family protein n=1 Tax=Streptomyces sp. WAC06614 TaxID=2487416 RepID=UPI000F782E46|nr:hypothetical protein [Streptomyces sp. WAC06614]RSS73348.1 hypothetical protein EF918_25645 [Streptomyces sp. WAC06614]
MTYYPDLATYDYDYHAPPEGLTIGWLEGDEAFPTGESSDEFVTDLLDLGAFLDHKARGFHHCTICPVLTEPMATSPRTGQTYPLGHAEIRATAPDGTLYVAPNLIIHYVQEHGYLPPTQFVEAVRAEVVRRYPAG